MSHFDTEVLAEIFQKNQRNPDLIGSRESTTLEFKEVFSFGSLPEYAKTMAAFANNEGGYIVFGIKDKPRRIMGIDLSQFDDIDQAKLTQGLHSIFQPAIEWDITTYDWDGLSFGVLYTFPLLSKPVIAIKNSGDIKDGEIYFRYRARSERIKFPELRKLLNDQIELRNEAWRRVFEISANIDPLNVALMDTISGEISGKGGSVVIDESLLPKLKFIREGDFSQKSGAPTLKLVGDLQAVPVTAIRNRKVVVGTDIYQFRPGQVAKKVQEAISKEFAANSHHIKAWKMYKPRPNEKVSGYKSEHAEFKSAENEYRYSQAWVDFLIQKLSSDDEYQNLLEFRS